MDEVFIIEFEFRSDGGPSLVGFFTTEEKAEEYIRSLAGPGWTATSHVVSIAVIKPLEKS